MITSKWIRPGESLEEARSIRRRVFQQELGWETEDDWDALDAYSFHLVLYHNERPAACGRISYGTMGTAQLGRISVLPEFRRQGIGDGLVKVLDHKASQLGMKYSAVEAPTELEGFYRSIGFEPTGNTYEKYGMTVMRMRKETNDGTRENCTHQCTGKKSEN